ncbi:hypothetical protein AWW72_12735 [Acinetobacter sp. NRRL B-65365]|uniref:hypothetical protein n=1 Tax=Acinetobacter sp. NRRL B-65365 TaxID=1785092 RepID=UPI0007A09F6F|nr:hypothetical protein [Acinetobacter sp. NRRL B-65365]KYQ83671.1 hypothetical protein AWW72_12735 [Acinetobacter sp. NRRL B-65365]
MRFLFFLIISTSIVGCSSSHLKPTKMYPGEIKPKSELAMVYIDWLGAGQYFKAGSSIIYEVNDQKMSENKSLFGSTQLVSVNPEELNIKVHSLIVGHFLDTYRGFEAWNVYTPIPPFKADAGKIYILCPHGKISKGPEDIKFNVHLYPFTEYEIFQNKGLPDFTARPCKNSEELKNTSNNK